jgi:hypothetical protein
MSKYKAFQLIGIAGIFCFSWLVSPSIASPVHIVLPNPSATPGSINADVNQSNIYSTICVSGYTAKIRPPASYTTKLKIKQLSAFPYSSYGSKDTALFEEDHLISLELGGNPTDPRNLWPEPWDGSSGARIKDQLENKLHSLVCANQISLRAAQAAIATNWYLAYQTYVLGLVPSASTPTPTPSTTVSDIPMPTPTPSITVARTFEMPYFTDRIGNVLSNWSHTGFNLPPIVVQDSVPAGLICKPKSDSDFIISQNPRWKTQVTSETQVSLTIVCYATVATSGNQPSALPTSNPIQSASPTPLSTLSANTPNASASTPSIPGGATGLCKDGAYSFAKTHTGMCSGHGGVAQFYS